MRPAVTAVLRWKSVTATALNLMEAGFKTRESLWIALNALHPDA